MIDMKKQGQFIKWLKKNGIDNQFSSTYEMVRMQEVWQACMEDSKKKDAIIDSLQQLVRRAIKDAEYHTDYSEGSINYLDHDMLSRQMEYIRKRRASVLLEAVELGVPLTQ